MKKLLILISMSTLLLVGCSDATQEVSQNTDDAVVEQENITETEDITIMSVQEGTDDGIYTGVSSSSVGNIGVAFVTIENEEIVDVDLHEIGHGHGGMIMAEDKKDNAEYDEWMTSESAGTIWNDSIDKLESAVVEYQGAYIEDIDSLTGATTSFTSDELLIDAVNNAIIVAKNSSDIFNGGEPTLNLIEKENRELYTEVQEGTDDGIYTGISTSSVGNVGISFVTITDEKIENVEFHEIGHGHGGMIMAQDKRDNAEYDEWMMSESAGTIWNESIKELEQYIVETQSTDLTPETVDSVTGATAEFTSNELLLEATTDAITVAKESSDIFNK